MKRSIAILSLVFLLSPTLFSQETRPRIAKAARVDTAPAIDGSLNDAVWQQADVITDFIQSEPFEGQPATEKTEVRVLYSKDTLYLAVMCYDSEPDKIIVSDSRRDSGMDETDSFQIILDTYHDRQNGFVFGTNPAGIEYDAQVTNEGEGGRPGPGQRTQSGQGGGFNLNWDASWRVSAKILDNGWAAEFAIPLRTLRYGDKPQTWGLNFQRNIRRKREEIFWAPIERIYNLYRLSSAGELQGLELETPRNFKVTPYIVSSALRDFSNRTQQETDFDADVGVDAKFGVTPSLNLDLTYNTDFAQVEVDEQQVNLTRFNLFFPEKRGFFLENAGLFAVGRGNNLSMFFSRRIGISNSGNLVPIVGGTRLTGKVGSFNLGLMNMQTKRVASVTPANNFSVARLSKELPNRSSIGGIFVNRQATGTGAGTNNYNRTYAIDGKLGVGRGGTFTGFAAGSETPGLTGSTHAYMARGEYQRTAGRTHFEYAEVGRNFNPEVGFLERKAFRNIDTAIFTNVRFRDNEFLRETFREWRPHASYTSYWDLNGFQETARLHVDVHFDFENGYYFSPAFNRTYEGLKAPFEIFPGIKVAPGKYIHNELAWRANTNVAAPASLNAELDWGGFLSGNQRSFGLTAAGRKGSDITTSLRWRRNDIRLKEGAFKTNLLQWRVSYSFTPLRYIQTLIQYNDRIKQWSANVRMGLLNTAGTGLFVVYNETQGLNGLGPINRSFVVKYTRQFDVLR